MVIKKKKTVKEVMNKYNIPQQTLRDRVKMAERGENLKKRGNKS